MRRPVDAIYVPLVEMRPDPGKPRHMPEHEMHARTWRDS